MKISLFACASVVLIWGSGLAESAAPTTHWLIDAAGCKFASPVPPPDAARPSFRFTGTCLDGFVAGTGEVTLDVSAMLFRGEFQQGRMVKGVVENRAGTYEGALRDNVPNGQGTFTSHDGLVFKGRFENGRPAGSTGEVTWPTLGRYAGALDVSRLQPLGKGIMYYTNGAVLVGEFMEGEKAVGVLKHLDGTVSQGTFVGGLLQGEGKIEWANGARYEGDVKASEPGGRGHMERPTGEIYDGDFVTGRYHGKGTLKWARGDVYVGDFVLGTLHGNGELKHANGDIESGEWNDGLLHGKCRIVTEKEKYEGTCKSGTRDGQGHWEGHVTRRTYDGDFKDDQFHGKGKLRAMTGDGTEVAYDGEFSQGLMQGAGVLTIGALTFDGTFKADEFVGGKVVANGRAFEVDGQTGAVVEVLKDGSKQPLDALPADITP
jgi:hypothetical protein